MSNAPVPVRSLRTPALSMGSIRLPAQIVGGSLVMALAAHVAVPFWPVPLTLQTLAVLALGAALGPMAAMAAVLTWMIEGAAGLPVFAAGAGPAVLLGPTGGYILGYLPAALVAGLAARSAFRGAPVRIAATFVAADLLLFAFGVAWLTHLIGWDKAFAGGLTPFIPGEALKIGLATAAATLLSVRRTRRD